MNDSRRLPGAQHEHSAVVSAEARRRYLDGDRVFSGSEVRQPEHDRSTTRGPGDGCGLSVHHKSGLDGVAAGLALRSPQIRYHGSFAAGAGRLRRDADHGVVGHARFDPGYQEPCIVGDDERLRWGCGALKIR